EGRERQHGALRRPAPVWPGRRAWSWRPGPAVVSLFVGGAAVLVVFYPIFYLIQASLSVGDPQARPPEAYGLANFVDLTRYAQIFLDTIPVSVVAAGF